jgi:YD repeat-containing protein
VAALPRDVHHPDISRFVDLNNDGIPDLLAPARSVLSGTFPEADPDARTSARRESGPTCSRRGQRHRRRPVCRLPARGTQRDRARPERSSGSWTGISDYPYAGTTNAGSREDTTYSYSGGRFDFKEREFLGFGNVRAVSPQRGPGGQPLGTKVDEREFYRSEFSGPVAANPLKGILKATTTSSLEGTLEIIRTQQNYQLVPPTVGNITRVRATSVETTICPPSGCSSEGPMIDQLTTFSDFDDYDNARTETLVAARMRFDDGFDGTVTRTQTRTFKNNLTEWILGQVETYARSDSQGTLNSAAYTYNHDKVATVTEQRYGVLPTCADTTTTFVTERSYSNVGNLFEERTNNHLIAGGAQPRRVITYDPDLEVYPFTTTDYYTRGTTAGATLIKKTIYDARFALVTSETDPNNNTTRTIYDVFGRPSQMLSAEGALVRSYGYDLASRPIRTFVTDIPGSEQPSVGRVTHFDGRGRTLQVTTYTDEVGNVDQWVRYDTTGSVAEGAVAFEASANDYVPADQMTSPRMRQTADPVGRPQQITLADGRTTSRQYLMGTIVDTDPRGTPSTTYLDGLGRIVAIDESFRPAAAQGDFVTHRTTFALDGDGRILSSVNPDTRERHFSYNNRGQLVSASTATGDYQLCFDGAGAPTRLATPNGRVVKEKRDELGRVVTRTHEPAAQFASDDVAMTYDDPTASNGLGRLTSSSNAKSSASYGYDVRGQPDVGVAAHRLRGGRQPLAGRDVHRERGLRSPGPAGVARPPLRSGADRRAGVAQLRLQRPRVSRGRHRERHRADPDRPLRSGRAPHARDRAQRDPNAVGLRRERTVDVVADHSRPGWAVAGRLAGLRDPRIRRQRQPQAHRTVLRPGRTDDRQELRLRHAQSARVGNHPGPGFRAQLWLRVQPRRQHDVVDRRDAALRRQRPAGGQQHHGAAAPRRRWPSSTTSTDR